MATANPLRVELGQRLRALREAAGVKTAAVDSDEVLGWYPGKTSKVETGTRVPGDAEIHRLGTLYGITDAQLADLKALARGARKRTRMPHVADFARSYVLLEQEAEAVDYHDAELIPAVLQAPGYARDLLSQVSHDDLEVRVAERLERGRLLSSANAPRFRAILGEAALHRQPRDRAAALEQLERLLEYCTADQADETRGLRILPFDVGLHPVVGVGFTIVRLSSPAITRVYLEGATAATYLHEPAETDVYASRFERLRALAADRGASATLLRRHIQQLEHRRRNG
ncbi:Helix-turn-helix domain-containing protein [Lentzea xinjiangensis]|uniref:Helix-turn-helix domain-containing protein n=1 Tax=Lentzea xinjiangensis TaxID=402600 RepID=A0A1H9TCH7_9PSEU|nr:helix-turn-helix transcriptional regulator [Lentzea xinjiangensis]SER94955.1 Helix-turn-helix domain-containing protein [Lentzea xinjiangensis]